MGILNQLSLTISRISRRFEAQTWIRQLDLTNKILKFGKKIVQLTYSSRINFGTLPFFSLWDLLSWRKGGPELQAISGLISGIPVL